MTQLKTQGFGNIPKVKLTFTIGNSPEVPSGPVAGDSDTGYGIHEVVLLLREEVRVLAVYPPQALHADLCAGPQATVWRVRREVVKVRILAV